MAQNENDILLGVGADITDAQKELKKLEKESNKGEVKIKPEVDAASVDKAKKSIGSISETIKDIGSNFGSIGSSIATFLTSPAGLAAGAFTAMGLAAKQAFELALKGEEEAAIGKRFEILADQAGLFPETLKTGISSAIGGVVDLEDALKVASQSLVELNGASSDQISGIFELARKTSEVFGGDILNNVDKLSAAIANSTPKALKSLGIQVDLKKAQEDYAKSIGVTADQLTLAEKQQANLNAVLSKGTDTFKNIQAGGLTPLKTSFDQFKVTVGDVKDKIAELANESFGGIFQTAVTIATKSLKDFFDLNKKASEQSIPELKKSIADLTTEIENNSRAARFNANKDFGDAAQVQRNAQLTQSLKEYNQQLLIKQAAIEDERKAERLLSQPSAPREKSDKEIADLKAKYEERQKLALKASQEELQLEIQNRTAKANLNKSLDFNELATIQAFADQKLLEEQNHKNRLLAIEENYKALKGSNTVQQGQELTNNQIFNNLIEAEKERSNQALLTLDAQKNTALVQGQLPAFSSIQAFTSQTQKSMEGFTIKTGDGFKALGKAATVQLAGSVGNAMAAFGEALATGGDAGQAFLKSILGVIGDMCIQLGSAFILQGLGFTANPLMPGSGIGLTAAGVALAALGGAIKGVSGSMGAKKPETQPAAQGTDNFQSPFASSQVEPTSNFQQAQRTDPESRVNVVLNGPVYNSDEMPEVLAGIISDAVTRKGIKFSVA